MRLAQITVITALAASSAVTAGGFKATFETQQCNGDSGFAPVEIDRIYRIETTDCGPENPEKKLKQVLVRSHATGFDVFLLSETAAKSLQEQIKHYQGARLRAVERGGTVYIERY